MKRSGLTLGLALLATGFLLGCQDSTSNPVTPDLPGPEFHHDKGGHADGGGGGGGPSTTVSASAGGAIETIDPVSRLMQVHKDNKFDFRISTTDGGGDIDWNFSSTYEKTLENCTQEGLQDEQNPEFVAWEELFGLLISSQDTDAGFGMDYDREASGGPSEDHAVRSVDFTVPLTIGDQLVIIGIGDVAPSVHATMETVDGNDVYTFSGGTVRVWKKANPNTNQFLLCPNDGDEVVVTVFAQ